MNTYDLPRLIEEAVSIMENNGDKKEWLAQAKSFLYDREKERAAVPAVDDDLDTTQALKRVVENLSRYFYCEMGWENFRAEFLCRDEKQEKTHAENARQR